MKNFFKKLVVVFIFMNFGLTVQMAFAAPTTAPATPPTPPTQSDVIAPLDYLKTIGGQTKLPNYVDTGVHPDAPAETKPGVSAVSSPIYYAIDLFRYAVSTIAFIFVIIVALKLVTTANEEEAKKAKDSLLMGIVGLIIIQLADVAVKQVFFGQQGQAFQDVATTKLYAAAGVDQIRGIIGFLEVFLGAAAVLTIVITGFTLLASGGAEEDIGKAKKHILYAIVGLLVVGLSEVIVRGFIFPANGTQLPNVDVGKMIIVSITNYLAGFIAVISFVMLFYGGYRYVTSGGEDEVKEKVKKIILSSVIALILAMAAFAIVNTVVKFDTTPKVNAPQSVTNTP